MLAIQRITEVADELARAKFGPKRVEEVRVAPIADWTGTDALDVLIVLRPSAVRLLKSTDAASAMLNDLGDRLGELGENRFAYVGYATREELEAVDDPES